jgi:hypothetical protein
MRRLMPRNPLLFGVEPPTPGAPRVESLRFVKKLGDRSAASSVLFFAVVGAAGIGAIGFVAAAATAALGLANHLSIARKIHRLER